MTIPPMRLSPTHLVSFLFRALIKARKAAKRPHTRRRALEIPDPSPRQDDWEQSLPCLFHEMLNYSSTLRNNALLLRRTSLPENISGPLGRLERTTEKIEILAREVMELGSVTRVTRTEILEARCLVECCIADHFPERRAAFEILAEKDGLSLHGDWPKLERVFLNLFRNAFEAGARNIRIRLTAIRGRLLILVEDDGMGCPEDQAPLLFRRHHTTKREMGGSGLGLFMAKAILEAHGGGIRAVTKNTWSADEDRMEPAGPSGTGMIFRLEFPLAGNIGMAAPFRLRT
jgi:signal transduction histidine kinase